MTKVVLKRINNNIIITMIIIIIIIIQGIEPLLRSQLIGSLLANQANLCYRRFTSYTTC